MNQMRQRERVVRSKITHNTNIACNTEDLLMHKFTRMNDGTVCTCSSLWKWDTDQDFAVHIFNLKNCILANRSAISTTPDFHFMNKRQWIVISGLYVVAPWYTAQCHKATVLQWWNIVSGICYISLNVVSRVSYACGIFL